jgi:hypothetical protein
MSIALGMRSMSDILPKIGQLPGLVVVTAVQRQESVACDNAAKRPPAHHLCWTDRCASAPIASRHVLLRSRRPGNLKN